jgi:hypothetical protein
MAVKRKQSKQVRRPSRADRFIRLLKLACEVDLDEQQKDMVRDLFEKAGALRE